MTQATLSQDLEERTYHTPGRTGDTATYLARLSHEELILEVLKLKGEKAQDTRKMERLEKKVHIDSLLQIPNRGYFNDEMIPYLQGRMDQGLETAVVMIDVDHFGLYNEENGHLAGDVALQYVASIIKEKIREGDKVARYGGEEIAVVLPDITHDEVYDLIDRLREAVCSGTPTQDGKVLPGVTLSAGISLYDNTKQVKKAKKLLKQADIALYDAKKGGRNRVITHFGLTPQKDYKYEAA